MTKFVTFTVLWRQVMEVQPQAVLDVSVQCALEDSCLVFFDDTSMVDALAAFDDTGKTVGMVQVGSACCICCTCQPVHQKRMCSSSRSDVANMWCRVLRVRFWGC